MKEQQLSKTAGAERLNTESYPAQTVHPEKECNAVPDSRSPWLEGPDFYDRGFPFDQRKEVDLGS